MKDLRHSGLMWLKAVWFLMIGINYALLLLLEHPAARTSLQLMLAVRALLPDRRLRFPRD